MTPTCQDGRMPWPCQLAWGIALIACVAVLALVLSCLSPATGAAAGALGVGLGLYRGSVDSLVATGLLLVVTALLRGLVERGVVGGGGSALPSLLLLLALAGVWFTKPLFPQR